MVSEEGTRAEMGDEDDDLLRAAEELGIDLSGVRDRRRPAADEERPRRTSRRRSEEKDEEKSEEKSE